MKCPENMRSFCDDILAGEYDVPYHCTEPTVLDVGANCGAFTLWSLSKWPDAKVFCYEPGAEAFGYLTENCEGKATLINCALGDDSRKQLFRGAHNLGEASFLPFVAGTNESESVFTLNPLTVPHAQIIKVDTEGCECEIIFPLLEAGRKFDIILLEYHSEEDRRLLDSRLTDYVLCGAKIFHPNRGVLKYYHKGLRSLVRSEVK